MYGQQYLSRLAMTQIYTYIKIFNKKEKLKLHQQNALCLSVEGVVV